MKRATLAEEARDAGMDLRPTAPAPCLPFRFEKLERCDFKSKQAKFSIVIEGFGSVDGELFIPPDRPAFVQAASVRCKFTGQWCRTVRFEDDFREELLEAVLARLGAEKAEPA